MSIYLAEVQAVYHEVPARYGHDMARRGCEVVGTVLRDGSGRA